MKNLKDPKTKIFPSSTRGGKKLPSSSALDSPSVMSKLTTSPPHAINFDMSQVIDDATSTMNDAYDDASTMLDNDDVPLGEFLDEQIARVIQHDVESDDELEIESPETHARTSLPRYELPKVPEGYVMNEETTRDILACKDRDDRSREIVMQV